MTHRFDSRARAVRVFVAMLGISALVSINAHAYEIGDYDCWKVRGRPTECRTSAFATVQEACHLQVEALSSMWCTFEFVSCKVTIYYGSPNHPVTLTGEVEVKTFCDGSLMSQGPMEVAAMGYITGASEEVSAGMCTVGGGAPSMTAGSANIPLLETLSINNRPFPLELALSYDSSLADTVGAQDSVNWYATWDLGAELTSIAVDAAVGLGFTEASTASVRIPGQGRVDFESYDGGPWQAKQPGAGSFSSVTGGGEITGYQYQPDDEVTYNLDADGKVVDVTHVYGYTHTYSYDSDNRVSRIDTDTGEWVEFTRNAGGAVTRIDTHDGRAWVLDWETADSDSNQRMTKLTRPDGKFRTYHYEHPHAGKERFVTGVTDERGIRASTFTYDGSRPQSTERAGSAFRTDALYQSGYTRYTDSRGKQKQVTFTTKKGQVLPTQIEDCRFCAD